MSLELFHESEVELTAEKLFCHEPDSRLKTTSNIVVSTSLADDKMPVSHLKTLL
jgi:hypothetical protein